ncbi:MAG: hypothetical protein ACOYOU_10190 [Kiritimatiellia bacterium]
MKCQTRRMFVISYMLLCGVPLARADMEIAPRGAANANNEERAARGAGTNGRVSGELSGERLMDRLLANVKLIKELGLSDETVVILREESRQNKTRQMDLDAQILKLSLMQHDFMAKLLLDADTHTNEVMKIIEDIGRLRTEQAKLAVQNLLMIRKYLTPDQIRKARELMRERQQNNAVRREKAEARPPKKEKGAPPAGPQPSGAGVQ